MNYESGYPIPSPGEVAASPGAGILVAGHGSYQMRTTLGREGGVGIGEPRKV
jgi:hypothetical protein